MMAKGTDEKSQKALDYIAGRRSNDEVIREFFGINKGDEGKTPVMKRLMVRWHSKLAELGVSKEEFSAFFRDVLEKEELFPEDKKKEVVAKEAKEEVKPTAK